MIIMDIGLVFHLRWAQGRIQTGLRIKGGRVEGVGEGVCKH